MNAKEKNIISLLDKQIAELLKAKEVLISNQPLSDRVKENDWVIEKASNKYFQIYTCNGTSANLVHLIRKKEKFAEFTQNFNNIFRLASKEEVEQHERFLGNQKKATDILEEWRLQDEKANEIGVVACNIMAKELSKLLVEPEFKYGDWVIRKSKNQYYQFKNYNNGMVTLVRNGVGVDYTTLEFNKLFVKATLEEVKQHWSYIDKCGVGKLINQRKEDLLAPHGVGKSLMAEKKPSLDPMKCDFYMVTCTGRSGAKIRHTSFEKAKTEAERIAKLENHETWIVGVVASIKPITTTETKFELKLR